MLGKQATIVSPRLTHLQWPETNSPKASLEWNLDQLDILPLYSEPVASFEQDRATHQQTAIKAHVTKGTHSVAQLSPARKEALNQYAFNRNVEAPQQKPVTTSVKAERQVCSHMFAHNLIACVEPFNLAHT